MGVLSMSRRHEVYARELGQHAPDAEERLTDRHDGNVYIVAARGAAFAGPGSNWSCIKERRSK
jgi:hypothetical protein